MKTTADVIVLGMGPGGENVAGNLAEAGLDVIGIEHNLLGGECPYWGCVPSKMMIRAANLVAEARRIPTMAGHATITRDWGVVAQRIRDEATDDWNDKVAVERFEKQGGRFLRGRGTLTGPRSVEVDGTEYTAERALVVATGTEPLIPDIVGLADLEYWTNREAIEARTLPHSLVILGGGSVGVELGQVFARFGVRVAIVEGENRLVSSEEPEACELISQVFADEGIFVVSGAKATAAAKSKGIELTLSDDRKIHGDQLLVATGRKADLERLGVHAVGLDPDARFIEVDEHMRVTDGMWAIGDITGKGQFTHVSMYQAGIATADILSKDHAPADYTAMPRVIFTDPEIGAAGLTEAQARERGIEVAIGITQVSSSARGWIHKAGNGFIKLVADKSSGLLVGATSAGPVGGEVLSMLTLAIHARVPVEKLRQMIYAYPTFHRGIEDALRDLES